MLIEMHALQLLSPIKMNIVTRIINVGKAEKVVVMVKVVLMKLMMMMTW